MENFNSELYEKCVAASELLFTDMLAEVATSENLSDETIEIIKTDNAQRLYNLAADSKWLWGRSDELISSFEYDDDPESIRAMLGFFQTIF